MEKVETKNQNKQNTGDKQGEEKCLVLTGIGKVLESLSSISILGVAIIYQIILLYHDEKVIYGYIYMAILGFLFLIKAFQSSECSTIISRISIVIIWISWFYAPKFNTQWLVDLAFILLFIFVSNRMVLSVKEWLKRLKQDEELKDYENQTFYDIKIYEVKTRSEFDYLKHKLMNVIKNTGIEIKELRFQAQYILDKREERVDNLKTALFPSLTVFVGAYFGCITMFLPHIVSDKGITILIALVVALLLTLIISEVQVKKNKKAWIIVSFWKNVLEAIKEIESNK